MESKEYKSFIQGNLRGTAQPNAGAKILASAYLPVRPARIQTTYANIVAPVYHKIDTLVQQNVVLSASRDLLLSRLISGELSVTEAERDLDAAA